MAQEPRVKIPNRDDYWRRWQAMVTERSSFWHHWKELSMYGQPRSGRFFLTDRNKGTKKHNNILDSTGTRALRTLGAGMQAGMTSPARPWFRVKVGDPKLNEVEAVKIWCNDVTELMREIFQKSNTYRSLQGIYGELGLFGTGCDIVLDNFETVIHHHGLTAGEYCLATDQLGNVNTMYREFEMTVSQMVGQFGYGKCSSAVRNMYDNGTLDSWVPVLHLIEPRKDRDPRMKDAANMPFASVYCEFAQETEKKTLADRGFKEFPVLAPRWDAKTSDIYGTDCPGMEALGDIKQLQHQQMRKGQAIDYKVKPPLQVPNSLKNREIDMLPGGVSFYDSAAQSGGIKSLFEVNLEMNALLEDIQDVRGRINQSFYADLFLMLMNDDRSNITAREIAERHEEKLLMLGPVLERLNNEMLDPLIDITFAKIVQAGILPEPPAELQNAELAVEYVSMLAQAQRAVGTGAVDRLLGTVGAIANMKPEALDKLDADQIVDHYAELLGVDPSLILGNDKVAIIRKDRAAQQQQMQQMAMVQPMADTAKTLSEAKLSEESALTTALDQFSST